MDVVKKELLVVGHPLVVNLNRKFWSVFAQNSELEVDLIVPARWKANLIKKLEFSYDPSCDRSIRQIFPISTLLKGNGSLFIFSPFALWRIFRHRYDYIIVNQEGWSLALVMINLIRLLTRHKETPTFITANQNIKKEKWKWMHGYERWNCKHITGILYCSNEVKEVLEWKQLPAKYIYFPFAFDDELYHHYLERRIAPISPVRIGYFGRLSKEKGIHTLLQACEQIAQQHEIKLVIGGGGELESELDKYPFVDFIGTVPHDQGHQFYSNIDIFILPSETTSFWKEQFGRVLVEAAAAKCWVIGSNSGAIPEVLGKLKMPFLFKEGDVDDLKMQIINVLNKCVVEQDYLLLEESQRLSFNQFSYSSVAKDLLNQIVK